MAEAARALILLLLLVLTSWNATRSSALDEADVAYARRDALTALRRALDHQSRRPWSHAAVLTAARCLSDLNHALAAEPYYRQARRSGPLSLEDLHRRAYALVRANARIEAMDAYDEILARRPDDETALRRKAAIYYSLKSYDRARPLAERLRRLPGGGMIGHALLGAIEHEANNYNMAVECYLQVLKLDPRLTSLPFQKSVFWTELTNDLILTGRPEEVRRLLLGALEQSDDATLHYLRGKAEEALGDHDEAEQSCRRAVERDPRLRGAWTLLGMLALQRQDPSAAVEALERAWAIQPDIETAYNLQLAHHRLGHTMEAARYAKRFEQMLVSGGAKSAR